MTVKIQFRRGTAAEWTAANPTLSAGETGFETDTGATKIGTGVATWTSLPYAGGADASTTGKGIVQLAGDLAGTAAAPTIGAGKVVPSKLGGAVDGQVPSKAAGTDTWTWVAPGAIVPDADATTKGKVQLTGDLGGTAASPTVPGLTSKVQLGGDLGGGTISAPQVTATHLASALPQAQGGTAATSLGAGAITPTGAGSPRSLADIAAATLTYDLLMSFSGKPDADEVLARVEASRAFTVAAALAGTQASSGTAPTAQAVVTLKKNTVAFGTVTYETSGSVTLASASGATFAAGDLLTVHAPASQDATLADLSISLAGAL